MAKQVLGWYTNRGEPASSEADALMGDASAAIEDYAHAHTDTHSLDFSLGEWLHENCDQLLPLLQAYADAKAKRHAEIHGGRS
jgi:hypothetical protein